MRMATWAAPARARALWLAPPAWAASAARAEAAEAVEAAWSAFQTGELEPSSPWRPVSWPYYSALALGLVVFALQAIVQCGRHVLAASGRGPTPLNRAGGSA